MARYTFRLEQVLKFRQEVEKLHQLELAAAKQMQEEALERLRNERTAMEALAREFAERQRRGINANDLQLFGEFSRRKAEEIQGIRDSLPALEQNVQEKHEALVAAAKEKKALEVFKEKKMRDLTLEQMGKERAFLDELAVQGRGVRS
jgi:flagellar protein FliJ